jgi:hypothetical protein
MVSGLGAMNYTERLKELKMTTLVERREETNSQTVVEKGAPNPPPPSLVLRSPQYGYST